jgi:hypothetical protein
MKSLLDLLPKGGNSMVDSLKNEMKFFRRILFLIQEAEEGILHFLKGDLSKFDAHVGETSCQVRAYYFALLWLRRDEVFPVIEKDLQMLKKYVDQLVILLDQGKLDGHRFLRPSRMIDFLNNLAVTLFISEETFILTVAYFLQKYAFLDEQKISQEMDEKSVELSMLESTNFVTQFLRHLQRALAELSINFIHDLVQDFPEKQKKYLSTRLEIFPSLLKNDSMGRLQLPCISSFEVIIRSLEQNMKIPVVLVLSFLGNEAFQEAFVFCSNGMGVWKEDSLIKFPPDAPLFVLRGLTSIFQNFPPLERRKKILACICESGLSNILLAFGAEHIQYSFWDCRDFEDAKFSEFFKKYYRYALENRISLNLNRDIFLSIRHCFGSTHKEFKSISKYFPMLNTSKNFKERENETVRFSFC